jgi:FtsZ-interacting cell division protein YlmF
MGFMNWLMKGVGFEEEQVYDDSIEKEKKREAKLKKKEEERRKKEEYKARLAQEKADKAAKKFALRQEKDIDVKPQSTVSYVDNPDQYNTLGSSYSSPIRQSSYGMSSNVGGYGTKNVEFLYPTSFDDAQVVINYLKEGETVVLNLNNMNEYDSQRLLDCASGAIYALNGNIRHVDNNIFLLTPEGFNIKTPEGGQNGQN